MPIIKHCRRDWRPARSDLEDRIKGLDLDDVGDGTKAASTRTKYEGPTVKPLVQPIYHTSTYIVDSVQEYLDIIRGVSKK